MISLCDEFTMLQKTDNYRKVCQMFVYLNFNKLILLSPFNIVIIKFVDGEITNFQSNLISYDMTHLVVTDLPIQGTFL